MSSTRFQRPWTLATPVEAAGPPAAVVGQDQQELQLQLQQWGAAAGADGANLLARLQQQVRVVAVGMGVVVVGEAVTVRPAAAAAAARAARVRIRARARIERCAQSGALSAHLYSLQSPQWCGVRDAESVPRNMSVEPLICMQAFFVPI